MSPEASVVIPAYNGERYIAQALRSVLGQTERRIEVIVVDDVSTDATERVVENFSDERLKLLANDFNQGPSVARNRAIKEARGEWIALLDQDDWYAPERLERLLRVARTTNADVVADDVYFVQDGDDRPWDTLLSLGGWDFDGPRVVGAAEFVDSNTPGRRCPRLGLTKPLIRRSFLLRHELAYDDTIRGGDEDFHLYFDCLLRGARFVLVPEPYYFYRRHEGAQTSGNRLDMLETIRRGNVRLLQRELVRENPELVCALWRRLVAIEQQISYYRVVRPVKQRNFLEAIAEVVRNPSFFKLLAKQVPLIFHYRLRRLAGRFVPKSKLRKYE